MNNNIHQKIKLCSTSFTYICAEIDEFIEQMCSYKLQPTYLLFAHINTTSKIRPSYSDTITLIFFLTNLSLQYNTLVYIISNRCINDRSLRINTNQIINILS